MISRIAIAASLVLSLAAAIQAQDTIINAAIPAGQSDAAVPSVRKQIATWPTLGWNSNDSRLKHIKAEETRHNLTLPI